MPSLTNGPIIWNLLNVLKQYLFQGDSGGGLICQRPDGTPVVAGVASYVFNCDEGFGVFANTEHFLSFIQDHMDVWQWWNKR